jgi:type VI secretion system protein ImpC
MPSSIELNVAHMPSPRRQRIDDDGDTPFRIVVLGDFSGLAREERGPLAERRPIRVDIDNLEDVFSRIAPVAVIGDLQDKLGIALRIPLETLDDFSADAVLARLPAHTLARAAASPAAPPAPAPASTAPVEDTAAIMQRLLGGSLPAGSPALASAPAAPQADGVVDRFIRQLVGDQVVQAPPPAAPNSNDAAASLLRQVLRDPAWRRLECAWRAVDRFVRELDMADGRVRLELLDCRADELLADVAAASGDPSRAAFAAQLARDGRACDLVVSLEEFGASLPELSLLGGLAAVASAQGAVLLAGAAPALVAVAASDDPHVLASSESRVWSALRQSALASHVGLTFPRLLARLPYGPRQDPVAAFAFDELADVAVHDGLVWRSAALDAALLLAQGHAQGGIETVVQLPDLPAFVDRSGDEPRLQAVAEAYLSDGETDRLHKAGLLVLQSDRRVPQARLTGWRSIASGDGALRGSWRA